jgi:hypothetical protein
MAESGTLSRVRRVRRSEAEWGELFARFDESAQTRERFCAEQDVVLSSFIRWWKKLRQSVATTASSGTYRAQRAPHRLTPHLS